MQPPVKAVILGVTNSGKSTIATILKERNWPIFEVDDEAQKRNGDVWPESEVVLDLLFKEINEAVFEHNDIIFVTSFLDIEDTKRFFDAGFKIIEIHANYEELRRRKIQRDGCPHDEWERFNRNYQNFQKYLPRVNKYVCLSLDTTNKKSELLANEVEQELIR